MAVRFAIGYLTYIYTPARAHYTTSYEIALCPVSVGGSLIATHIRLRFRIVLRPGGSLPYLRMQESCQLCNYIKIIFSYLFFRLPLVAVPQYKNFFLDKSKKV